MKPRSLRMTRSTRSFIREIVIVTVGVLIALVLQELVGNWRDRQRTAAVRESMKEELADFLEVLSLRIRSGPCITAKLDALDAVLRSSGSVGPWENVGRPSYFFSSQGAWSGASTDLLSTQLRPQTFKAYGELYQGMTRFAQIAQREQDHWIVLQSLERQDEPVAGARRWGLLEAVAGARNEALILMAIAEQMTTLGASLGIKPNGSLGSLDIRSRPLCQPLRKAGRDG